MLSEYVNGTYNDNTVKKHLDAAADRINEVLRKGTVRDWRAGKSGFRSSLFPSKFRLTMKAWSLVYGVFL